MVTSSLTKLGEQRLTENETAQTGTVFICGIRQNINSMNKIRYPIKLIAIAAIICVTVMFGTTWVSHSGYHTLLATGSDAVRLQRLRAKLWKRESADVESASVLAVSGDELVNGQGLKPKYDRVVVRSRYLENKEMIASIREAIDSEDLSRVRELAIITERAATAMDALENQSEFLQRSGKSEEAKALLASKGYQEQNQIIVRGLNTMVGMIHEDSTNRIEQQKKQYRLVLWGVPLATLLLTGVWLTVIRNLRRWGREFETQQKGRAVAEAQVLQINQELEQRIDTRTAELRESERRLHHQAYFDELTGLPNRRSGLESLGETLPAIESAASSLLLMIVDLDDFKRVNDTLGHGIGDNLLLQAAQRIKQSVREADTVVRLGGDEFLVIADMSEESEDQFDVGFLAKRVLKQFEYPFNLGDGRFEINVSPSVGVAIAPRHGDDVESIMRNADMAMYAAKYRGRNCYHVFDSAMNTKAMERLQLESKLRKALEQQQFSLHYQPQIDLNNGAIVGVEALLRWQEPESGFIAPLDFIPVAEETGLIMQIGDWVLNEACRQMAKWHSKLGRDFVVAVNVSPVQLRQPEFFEQVERALHLNGVAPASLELELTESALLQDGNSIRRTLSKLNDLGVKLSLDDFGTGYSALGYLKRYNFDILKIDRSFISGMQDTETDATLVQAIITMAHGLNMKIVGEGTETSSQCDALRDYGCDMAQGFFYSKPLPSQDLMEFIDQWSKEGLRKAS